MSEPNYMTAFDIVSLIVALATKEFLILTTMFNSTEDVNSEISNSKIFFGDS